jgi:hypothetical protein
MAQPAVSSELLQLGEDTIGRMMRVIEANAPVVHLQLFASRFYEELVGELQRTPRSEPAKIGMLAAAADRCRRTTLGVAPSALLIELKAIIAMLRARCFQMEA